VKAVLAEIAFDCVCAIFCFVKQEVARPGDRAFSQKRQPGQAPLASHGPLMLAPLPEPLSTLSHFSSLCMLWRPSGAQAEHEILTAKQGMSAC
jgi:hypothetical protein